jgi:hypothetical protein
MGGAARRLLHGHRYRRRSDAPTQKKAEAFVDTPNTVLRRLLGLGGGDGSTTSTAVHVVSPGGKLAVLLDDGYLEAYERLKWERRQHRQTYWAQVVPGGRIELRDVRVFGSPSGAARALAGYEVNGLRMWRRERDDKTLEELWEMREKDSADPTGGRLGVRPPPPATPTP